MSHLNAFLDAMQADAAVVYRPENLRWLAGYTGEGCLFVTRDTRAIVTDFRYIEQAGREAPGWQVLRVGANRDYAAILSELAAGAHAHSAYLETDYVTYDGYQTLSCAMKGVEIMPMKGLCEGLRRVKDASELECIQKACDIASRAFEDLITHIHAGMTERQVQRALEFTMLEMGSEGAAFDTIAASGPNGALPHATPSDRVIEEGELLTLDFGATIGGYKSDMTRTVGFGHVSGALRELYDTVLKAQLAALEVIGPGRVCGDVDRVARDMIDAKYPGAFGHSLGHGVGLFIHEQPRVGAGSQDVLVPGNVVTVEPGIYVPGLGGCRIEDTVIITDDGIINAIGAPKQLIEL